MLQMLFFRSMIYWCDWEEAADLFTTTTKSNKVVDLYIFFESKLSCCLNLFNFARNVRKGFGSNQSSGVSSRFDIQHEDLAQNKAEWFGR